MPHTFHTLCSGSPSSQPLVTSNKYHTHPHPSVLAHHPLNHWSQATNTTHFPTHLFWLTILSTTGHKQQIPHPSPPICSGSPSSQPLITSNKYHTHPHPSVLAHHPLNHWSQATNTTHIPTHLFWLTILSTTGHKQQIPHTSPPICSDSPSSQPLVTSNKYHTHPHPSVLAHHPLNHWSQATNTTPIPTHLFWLTILSTTGHKQQIPHPSPPICSGSPSSQPLVTSNKYHTHPHPSVLAHHPLNHWSQATNTTHFPTHLFWLTILSTTGHKQQISHPSRPSVLAHHPLNHWLQATNTTHIPTHLFWLTILSTTGHKQQIPNPSPPICSGSPSSQPLVTSNKYHTHPHPSVLAHHPLNHWSQATNTTHIPTNLFWLTILSTIGHKQQIPHTSPPICSGSPSSQPLVTSNKYHTHPHPSVLAHHPLNHWSQATNTTPIPTHLFWLTILSTTGHKQQIPHPSPPICSGSPSSQPLVTSNKYQTHPHPSVLAHHPLNHWSQATNTTHIPTHLFWLTILSTTGHKQLIPHPSPPICSGSPSSQPLVTSNKYHTHPHPSVLAHHPLNHWSQATNTTHIPTHLFWLTILSTTGHKQQIPHTSPPICSGSPSSQPLVTSNKYHTLPHPSVLAHHPLNHWSQATNTTPIPTHLFWLTILSTTGHKQQIPHTSPPICSGSPSSQPLVTSNKYHTHPHPSVLAHHPLNHWSQATNTKHIPTHLFWLTILSTTGHKQQIPHTSPPICSGSPSSQPLVTSNKYHTLPHPSVLAHHPLNHWSQATNITPIPPICSGSPSSQPLATSNKYHTHPHPSVLAHHPLNHWSQATNTKPIPTHLFWLTILSTTGHKQQIPHPSPPICSGSPSSQPLVTSNKYHTLPHPSVLAHHPLNHWLQATNTTHIPTHLFWLTILSTTGHKQQIPHPSPPICSGSPSSQPLATSNKYHTHPHPSVLAHHPLNHWSQATNTTPIPTHLFWLTILSTIGHKQQIPHTSPPICSGSPSSQPLVTSNKYHTHPHPSVLAHHPLNHWLQATNTTHIPTHLLWLTILSTTDHKQQIPHPSPPICSGSPSSQPLVTSNKYHTHPHPSVLAHHPLNHWSQATNTTHIPTHLFWLTILSTTGYKQQIPHPSPLICSGSPSSQPLATSNKYHTHPHPSVLAHHPLNHWSQATNTTHIPTHLFWLTILSTTGHKQQIPHTSPPICSGSLSSQPLVTSNKYHTHPHSSVLAHHPLNHWLQATNTTHIPTHLFWLTILSTTGHKQQIPHTSPLICSGSPSSQPLVTSNKYHTHPHPSVLAHHPLNHWSQATNTTQIPTHLFWLTILSTTGHKQQIPHTSQPICTHVRLKASSFTGKRSTTFLTQHPLF